MNRKDKRGFLLAEETLKMVIAVIAIGFLIYFLTSIYLKSKESKDLELAKASLEHLIEEINLGHDEVEIYNPKGWWISSWPYEDNSPKFCKNLGWNECICICDEPWINSASNFLDLCDEKGICLENVKKLVVRADGDYQSPIEIKNPPIKLNIDLENKIIK
jgi:hypothetical protein